MKATDHIAKSVATTKTGSATLRGLSRTGRIGTPKMAPRSGLRPARAPGAAAKQMNPLRNMTVSALIAGCLFLGALGLPATAGAYATLEGPPTYSSAPGLPDGRVYEEVSPANQEGSQAGATTVSIEGGAGSQHYALATPDGDSLLFEATGAMGETDTAESKYYVATRTSSGWHTRAVFPRPQQPNGEIETLDAQPYFIDPSQDLSHAMIAAGADTLAPGVTRANGERCPFQMYLTGPNPFLAATWLDRPSPEVGNPSQICSAYGEAGKPVGGTPDFSTVYFTYPGTLLPADAERTPHAQPKYQTPGEEEEVEASGFYEDREGTLREASVLPDGKPDPFGAVPAASGAGRTRVGNQVSADGSRAFFVSPDPSSCTYNGGQNDCATDPPELYVRENGERTQLVSRDTLLPDVEGLPAAAPGGPLRMLNPTRVEGGFETVNFNGSYVFASVDGAQAFFQSEDALTEQAQEVSPGTEAKTYDFDVNTGALTYLPNVSGRIVSTDTHGSAFVFVRSAVGGAPAELDLWSEGANGGSVTPIIQLPGGESVPEVQMSSDGSVVVFQTPVLIAGFNNGGSFTTGVGDTFPDEQIYRYDVAANTLGCVSCAPVGVSPGPASMSPLQHSEMLGTVFGDIPGMVDERGISANGDRIFFQTQAPLVPQDTNTATTVPVRENTPEGAKQGMDVYEWESGVVYLISTGQSSRNSFYLDSSENGEDVFFATTEGLVPGDTDGGYSVYDARVTHPGESAPAAVPCEGSVCQGPPNVPSPLTPPASATFSGLGNPGGRESNSSVTTITTKKTRTKAVRCKKGNVKKENKCVRRVKSKRVKSNRRGK